MSCSTVRRLVLQRWLDRLIAASLRAEILKAGGDQLRDDGGAILP